MKTVKAIMRFAFTAVAGTVLCASTASATTYYVSQSSGNDSLDGKSATVNGTSGPWQTLGKASSNNYAAGDSILLKRGDTWDEELQPKGSGTADSPITISAYGEGPKPLIDRKDYKKDFSGIHLIDQAGYKIVGIEFANCMTGIYGEYSDDSPTRKFVWIEDCYFHDALKYQKYHNYPVRKIGLGICFFSHECHNKIVLADVTVKNCVFRRLASGFWTNSPDNFNQQAGNIYNFGNIVFDGCLFEEGYQWQLGMRGVDGGVVRNCVTHDLGQGFRSFNGIAGAMFARCKNWVFENSEWGFISIGTPGKVSGDGQAFDFESNCDNMTMRNCLFHDSDGPGFLLCCYASGPEPEKNIVLENCVHNGKAMRTRENGMRKVEIFNTTDLNEATWKQCRFYLAPEVPLYATVDIANTNKPLNNLKFVDCLIKNLSQACSTANLAAKATVTASSGADTASAAIDGNAATAWKAASTNEEWIQLDLGSPQAITEFELKEDAASSVRRYVIQCWDDKDARWVGCFNGRTIGPDFVAPIVGRTAQKVRLLVSRTASNNTAIAEFAVYNDTTGEVYSEVTGAGPAKFIGK